MKKMKLFLRYLGAVTLAALVVGVVSTYPASQSSLPAFEVADLNRQIWLSHEIARDGRWLLIYVQPGCRPCERVLSTFKSDGAVEPDRIAVILGRASWNEARAMAGDFPELADALWFVDVRGEAFSSLKLKGAPVTHGIRDQEIAWRASGLVSGRRELKTILMSWLEE